MIKLRNMTEKKTDFAIKYAIGEDPWDTPDYIIEGLKWLSKGED